MKGRCSAMAKEDRVSPPSSPSPIQHAQSRNLGHKHALHHPWQTDEYPCESNVVYVVLPNEASHDAQGKVSNQIKRCNQPRPWPWPYAHRGRKSGEGHQHPLVGFEFSLAGDLGLGGRCGAGGGGGEVSDGHGDAAGRERGWDVSCWRCPERMEEL